MFILGGRREGEVGKEHVVFSRTVLIPFYYSSSHLVRIKFFPSCYWKKNPQWGPQPHHGQIRRWSKQVVCPWHRPTLLQPLTRKCQKWKGRCWMKTVAYGQISWQSDEVEGKCEYDGVLILSGVMCLQHWDWPTQSSSFSQGSAVGEMTSQNSVSELWWRQWWVFCILWETSIRN